MNKLQTAIQSILEFLLPHKGLRKYVESLSNDEFQNQAKRSRNIELKNCIAVFSYKDPVVRAAVLALKYHGSTHAAKLLAHGIYEDLIEYIGEKQTYERFKNPILIPIPLSSARSRERGFNQAELLARELVSYAPPDTFDVCTDLLRRIKNTESQTRARSREERFENIRGCFEVRNIKSISRKNIIVLDDVITTGATISEALKTLREAGAREVFGISAAH